MKIAPSKKRKVLDRNALLYQETIPLGIIYHSVMIAVLIGLASLLIIFIFTGIDGVGTIPVGLTLLLIICIYATFQKIELFVTVDEFLIRVWFRIIRIGISDIASVEVKDPFILPPPYKGHVKVFWGHHEWKDLKVIIFHKGDGIHIRKKNGELVIVTPQNPKKLCELLNQKIHLKKRTSKNGETKN